MSRISVIAFAVIMLSLSMNIFNVINNCYGNGCPAYNTNQINFTASGHKIVDIEITPLFSDVQLVKDKNGTRVNVTDEGQVNQTLSGMIEYETPSEGVIEYVGLMGLSIAGVKIIINTLFFPIIGLPTFLSNTMYVPGFISAPIGILMFILMMFGLIEFITGRLNYF